MKLYAHDGTPLHGGQQRRMANHDPLYSMHGLMEGVVLRAFYKDDPANKSKAWTEYTLLEVTSRMLFRTARVAAGISGFKNGREETLAETTGTTDGSLLVVEEEGMVASVTAQTLSPTSSLGLTPTTKLNGERVLFGCISGAHSQPVIVACLPHTEAPYFAERADAPRSYQAINGWTNVFANDGSLRFEHEDGRKIVANADGSIDIFPKSGNPLRLGGDTFSAVRGETNNENINGVIDQITALTEALGVYVVAIAPIADPAFTIDPATSPTGVLQAVLATIASSLAAISGSLEQALSPTPKVP